MSLSVIGAGMPRTGTMSLKLALEQLGFGPCYHMLEAVRDPSSWPFWIKASKGEPVEWDEVLAGWNSGCDAPVADFYKPIADYYPEAKVILSLRDPDRWYDSIRATIGRPEVVEFHRGLGSLPMVEAIGWSAADTMKLDREALLARFHRHNEEVKRTIPPERLLVFEASDGWEPLCRFLDVPVPDAPYPKVNTTEHFTAMIPARA